MEAEPAPDDKASASSPQSAVAGPPRWYPLCSLRDLELELDAETVVSSYRLNRLAAGNDARDKKNQRSLYIEYYASWTLVMDTHGERHGQLWQEPRGQGACIAG